VWKLDFLSTLCQRVVNPHLKHGKALLQFLRSCPSSAFDIARRDPPPGVSQRSAAIAIAEVLDSTGDSCLECNGDGS
jgi:hypothetical protein